MDSAFPASLLLAILPLVAAVASLAISDARRRARLIPGVATIHLLLLITCLTVGGKPVPGSWFALDALGSWFLLVISVLFNICAWYAPAYLASRPEQHNNHRILVSCMLAFLGLSSLVVQAQHPGVVWVVMEATTMTTAPMIYFNRHQRSLEATWKYLVIGSVGIALALLGTLFVAYAAHHAKLGSSLLFADLVSNATKLPPAWLRAGFVLLLVGYGTKMGLAPLHAWKPDAYGETPGMVGALLAGGVTNCAFLALLRLYAVVDAAGQAPLAREMLLALGFISMAWATVFMVRQTDIKRLLAYSSVEHMGILAIGIGLGGTAVRFALFHVAANSLVKAVLFLSAGNIHRAFASKHLPFIGGALVRVPVSGWLFLLGFIAITGSPPFAPFISEFGLVVSAFSSGQWWAGILFLILLGVIFLGMSSTVLQVVHGVPDQDMPRTRYEDTVATTLPIIIALILALILGVWLPGPLERMLSEAVLVIGGTTP
jgi:hydrogenase-4 component F